ncbi:PspC domain-containing protein [Nocardioides sp. Kera G14]|uniref:PspC domain-containing protein n=1 Tax=Nocardioides sp. Kera G14 TaxID=2884264 RepID=UPI001D10332B|nr:PspC domain-containing protein [Nocardioides sp. Kera G14]UDY24362.1 PspC domain-containing protein [Nocardioides sp. Kera G14]
MSTTDTETPEGPRVTRDEARDLSRLVRTSSARPENRYLAGVAGGIARHLDIDPIIVRIVLIVTVFFGGAGVLVYAAGWLFMPDERDGRAVITLDARNRAIALWIALALAASALISDVAGGFHFPWWIIPVLVIVALATKSWQYGRGGAPEENEAVVVEVLEKARAKTEAALAQARNRSDTAAAVALEKAKIKTDAALERAQQRAERAQQRWETKRGPLFFGFALALIVLAEGVLGVIDGAGASIAGPAYPALALGIIGLFLVLGAFWGRAGGLILLGLITAVILGLTTAADQWDVDGGRFRDLNNVPSTGSAVEDDYTFRNGDFLLDLTQVDDASSLAGRSIHIDGRAGRIRVKLPAGLNTQASAHISGPGYVQALGEEGAGFSQTITGQDGNGQGATVHIDADLRFGAIEIDEE